MFALRGLYTGAPARHGFAFGYGAIDERAIGEAFARLGRIWPRRLAG
jgi:DNA-binding transcriptional MocR family regulator